MLSFYFWWACIFCAIPPHALKIEWVMINFVIWWPSFLGRNLKKMQRVNMNDHAKSGASILKIERVVTNFVFWWPFRFWRPSFFVVFFAEGKYKLTCQIFSFYLKVWSILWFDNHFVFAGHLFCARTFFSEGQHELLCKIWSF